GGDAGRRAPGLLPARQRGVHCARGCRAAGAGTRRAPGAERRGAAPALVRPEDAATRRRMTTWPYPLWIAHRGAGKLAPENTLAAFRLGAAYGYRAFECDVKLSADGVPFLLHDATLERTTDGQGP